MVGADKKSSRAEDFARYKQYDYMAVRFILLYDLCIDMSVSPAAFGMAKSDVCQHWVASEASLQVEASLLIIFVSLMFAELEFSPHRRATNSRRKGTRRKCSKLVG